MLRRTWTALGRRTEFLEKLDLLQKGMETKEIKKKYWLKVYTEDCTMDASGNMIEGLENIIAPFPAFNAAFDVKPKILEVIGDEDAERFAVRYRHEARFTGNYGIVAVWKKKKNSRITHSLGQQSSDRCVATPPLRAHRS